jgi:hypothetical protein
MNSRAPSTKTSRTTKQNDSQQCESPRLAVGFRACAAIALLILCRAKAGDLDFEAAEIGMQIFADAIGNVDL